MLTREAQVIKEVKGKIEEVKNKRKKNMEEKRMTAAREERGEG